MNIIKRQVLLPGDRKVNVLFPEKICPDITMTDIKGYCYFMSNGTGYSMLADVFAMATSLEKDELIYYPFEFAHMDAYINDFPEPENHYKGMAIFNFIVTKISVKDISAALKTKMKKDEKLTRQITHIEKYPDRWKTRHKLTVKSTGKLLIISGERDVFTLMAQSCAKLAKYGDDADYNKYAPHLHHDMDENTAKSMGITFFYWHNGRGAANE